MAGMNERQIFILPVKQSKCPYYMNQIASSNVVVF